jgi:hypothetical protein
VAGNATWYNQTVKKDKLKLKEHKRACYEKIWNSTVYMIT